MRGTNDLSTFVAPFVPLVTEGFAPEPAESRLLEHGWRLVQMLDAAPQLVWTANLDGRLLYCNSEGRRRLGPCEGELAERVIPMKLLCAEDRQRWLTMWRRALTGGYAYEIEYTTAPSVNDSIHSYLERGVRVDVQGESARWFVTATRIDAQKRREEELLSVLRRKECFLLKLLHELRNPLAPIANATALLAKHSADPQAVISARDVIERQLQQLTRLMDDLVDLSRSARGHVALQRAPIDLREVVTTAIETAQPLIDRRRHCLETDIPASPIIAEVDKARLCQVIANLLINAAKYTDAGGRISISLHAGQDSATARIRDNGIGISADVLPRIFDLFTQAAPDSEAAMGGMGIGLAVARELVQLHGGSLCAYSAGRGCGSEFTVRLPLCGPISA